jgi:hypothetical protein
MVLVDTQVRRIEDNQWKNEYDRPMYFVELREDYSCGWFYQNRTYHAAAHPFALPAGSMALSG